LTDANYEVFAIDWRGFGESEGKRGVIESAEQMYGDQWLLIFTAIKQYKINLQTTKLVFVGRSFGSLIATNMSNTVLGKSMFHTGMIAICPCYGLYSDALEKKKFAFQILQYIKPYHQFCTKAVTKPKGKGKPRPEDSRDV